MPASKNPSFCVAGDEGGGGFLESQENYDMSRYGGDVKPGSNEEHAEKWKETHLKRLGMSRNSLLETISEQDKKLGILRENVHTLSKDSLTHQLHLQQQEILELKRSAMTNPAAILSSQHPDISDLRHQLALAAQALEKAGVEVPETLEAVQNKVAQAAQEARETSAKEAAAKARGVPQKIASASKCAITWLGSIEPMLTRFESEHRSQLKALAADDAVRNRRRKTIKARLALQACIQDTLNAVDDATKASQKVLAHLPFDSEGHRKKGPAPLPMKETTVGAPAVAKEHRSGRRSSRSGSKSKPTQPKETECNTASPKKSKHRSTLTVPDG
jgi:hypothetical protein